MPGVAARSDSSDHASSADAVALVAAGRLAVAGGTFEVDAPGAFCDFLDSRREFGGAPWWLVTASATLTLPRERFGRGGMHLLGRGARVACRRQGQRGEGQRWGQREGQRKATESKGREGGELPFCATIMDF